MATLLVGADNWCRQALRGANSAKCSGLNRGKEFLVLSLYTQLMVGVYIKEAKSQMELGTMLNRNISINEDFAYIFFNYMVEICFQCMVI